MPLKQLLLLAAARDMDLYPTWLSSEDNALADALSRLDLPRIADICPQLSSLSVSNRPPGSVRATASSATPI